MKLLLNHNKTVQGIAVLVLATVLFGLQDALTKGITNDIPAAQIVFIRFVAFALFALLYVHHRLGVRRAIRSAAVGRQILRTSVMCGEITLFTFGLRYMGVAEMHAIFSCFPLVVTALSVPMLNEQVGWRRWLAVTIGFIGTLVILRPGSGVYEIFAVIPLVCAVLYALYNMLTRQVSRQDPFETSLLYFGCVGMLVMCVPAWAVWQPLPSEAVLNLAALCAVSVTSHFLLIKALELTEAVILQPFNYLILVWVSVFGYLFFGEVLDQFEILGACIVVASGIYIGRREYRMASRA
ncbi:MAG: DMT family transporter [Gammaproteobacteria bacterium]|nr:DMT family transporter [Gammaproteobacteria bacterium]